MRRLLGLWGVVGKGVRGGKRAAFSAASAPVRRRRMVHTSTALRRSGAAARPALETSSPWKSKERRAVFSPITRTVAGACKPVFLQGGVVGIDVSKGTLDIGIEPTGEALRVVYDDQGIAQVVTRLVAVGPTLIVMEATGGLEVRLASELAGKGLPLAVINPRQARDFAKATGQLAKTDSG